MNASGSCPYTALHNLIPWNQCKSVPEQHTAKLLKLNHYYAENSFNLQKLQVKEAKPDNISLQESINVLQLIGSSGNKS